MKKILIISLSAALFVLLILSSSAFTSRASAQSEGANGLIATSEGDDPAVATSPASLIADKLIMRINLLNATQLSMELFSTPAFQSLSDFSEPIPDETAGRVNPFAPY